MLLASIHSAVTGFTRCRISMSGDFPGARSPATAGARRAWYGRGCPYTLWPRPPRGNRGTALQAGQASARGLEVGLPYTVGCVHNRVEKLYVAPDVRASRLLRPAIILALSRPHLLHTIPIPMVSHPIQRFPESPIRRRLPFARASVRTCYNTPEELWVFSRLVTSEECTAGT
jgi:hypothetical protein